MPPRSLIEEHYYRVNNRRVCECLSNILTRGITPTCLVDPRVPDPFTIGIVTTEETNFILKYVTPVSGHQNLHPFVSCRCLFTDPTPEGDPLISGPWPHVRPNSPHDQRRDSTVPSSRKKSPLLCRDKGRVPWNATSTNRVTTFVRHRRRFHSRSLTPPLVTHWLRQSNVWRNKGP